MKYLSKTTGFITTGIASISASLAFIPKAFADIPSVGFPNDNPGFTPSPAIVTTTTINYGSIGAYLLLTLLFELPIFYWLGFRSKKAITWAIIVNVITVPSYQIINTLMSGQISHGLGLVIAEVLITALEASLLVIFLGEISTKKIIIATVAANLFSAIIGGFIVNYLLGGIS